MPVRVFDTETQISIRIRKDLRWDLDTLGCQIVPEFPGIHGLETYADEPVFRIALQFGRDLDVLPIIHFEGCPGRGLACLRSLECFRQSDNPRVKLAGGIEILNSDGDVRDTSNRRALRSSLRIHCNRDGNEEYSSADLKRNTTRPDI